MKHTWKCFVGVATVAVLLLGATFASPDENEGDITVSSGLRLHYWQTQAGGNPAILLIPGWRTSALIWKDQMQRLGQTHRVVTFDPRSQGRSSILSEGNTPENRADDIAALIKQLKLQDAIVIGWSQGVQDVAAYVAKYGTGELSGFVLVDAPVSAGPKEIELSPEASEAILGNLAIYVAHPREFSEGMFGAIMKKKLPKSEMDGLVEQAMKTPTETGIAMLTIDIFAVDRRPALARFDKPTLLIASADLTPANAREMAKRMPSAKALEIKNAGHATFVDQPEEFAKAVLDLSAAISLERK